MIGLSIDSVEDHEAWSRDIEETRGHAVNYPIIGDTDLEVAKLFDMIHPNATGKAKERTAADNATIRSVFVIGPDKTVKLMLTYPMSTGRNFDEVLRVLDSMQLTAKHEVATPVNWKPGENVIIVPAVSDEEANSIPASTSIGRGSSSRLESCRRSPFVCGCRTRTLAITCRSSSPRTAIPRGGPVERRRFRRAWRRGITAGIPEVEPAGALQRWCPLTCRDAISRFRAFTKPEPPRETILAPRR